MPFRRTAPVAALLAALLAVLAGCSAPPPFAQLSGLMLDAQLDEVSGLAASARHEDVLWMVNDGGNDAHLYAVSPRGSRLATLRVDAFANRFRVSVGDASPSLASPRLAVALACGVVAQLLERGGRPHVRCHVVFLREHLLGGQRLEQDRVRMAGVGTGLERPATRAVKWCSTPR